MLKIHFNGVGYYYTLENGQQVSKQYSSVGRLRRYGRVVA